MSKSSVAWSVLTKYMYYISVLLNSTKIKFFYLSVSLSKDLDNNSPQPHTPPSASLRPQWLNYSGWPITFLSLYLVEHHLCTCLLTQTNCIYNLRVTSSVIIEQLQRTCLQKCPHLFYYNPMMLSLQSVIPGR